MCSLISFEFVIAQHTSKDTGGFFTDAETWIGSAPGKDVYQDFFINGSVNFDDDITIKGGDGNSAVNEGGYLLIENGKTLNLDKKDFRVKSGGILEISGYFTADQNRIFVDEGGILIVRGDMILSKSGSELAGNVIVLGNVELKNTEIDISGNLVVGGNSFTIEGGNDNYDGGIYILKPDAISDIPGNVSAVPGDISDLIETIGGFGDPIDEILGEHINSFLQINTWQGTDAGAEAEWMNDANWSENTPSILDNVVISSGNSFYPTLTGSVTIGSLTIESGAELTIAAGSQVTIVGELNVSGVLNMNNTVSQPVSLIVNGTTTGNVTIGWSFEAKRYWYIGHQIANPTIASYEAIVGDENNNNYMLYSYSGNWINETGTATFNEPLQGYSVAVKEAGSVISHTGPVNSDDYSKTLTDGWQLIANPYTSYYQITTEEMNGLELINTTGDVYIRTGNSPENRSYATFNTVSGIGSPEGFDGIVAPSQSFWVKRGQAGDIHLKTANRLHDVASSALKSAKSSEKNLIRLKLNDNEDETVIAFRPGAVEYFSRTDSEKRFDGDDKSYIYSLKDGKNIVINVLPSDNSKLAIPIGIKTLKGIHKLSISGLSTFNIDYDLLLEDKATSELIDLRLMPEYSFKSNHQIDNSRFVLHLKAAVSTGIESLEITENNNMEEEIKIHSNANVITINAKSVKNLKSVHVTIFSIKGEKIIDSHFNNNEIKLPIQVTTGHFIVKVTVNKQDSHINKTALLVLRKV